MIKPVYFPHTYISPGAAVAIRRAFTAVASYQAVCRRLSPDMQELAGSGFLEIISLAADDERRVERILEDFERWGRMQQGGGGLLPAFLSNRPGADPLTADGTAAQIASAVRRRPSAAPSAAAQDALMRSAVFLQLAYEADRRSREVRAALQRCERVHAELLESLAGEDLWPHPEPVAPVDGPPSEPESDSLVEQRVRAWARLFLHRPYAGPVFVASRPEVVALLAEKFPALRRVNRSALERTARPRAVAEPAAAEDFMSRLAMLASEPPPDSSPSDEGGDAGPIVYLVPDISPPGLFMRLAENGEALAAAAAATWRHTVVVEISRRISE